MRSRWVLGWSWFAIFGALAGCGGEQKGIPAGLVPFMGMVTLDDRPVDAATMVLIPVAAGSGSADAGAMTDDRGKYALVSAEGRGEGVLPGEYRVVISRFVKPDGTVIPPTPEKSPLELMTQENARESIPGKYSDFLRSRLKVTVPAEGGTFDFRLLSK